MDEQNTHEEDDFQDTDQDENFEDDELENTEHDDDLTPEKKETADDVKELQKQAWLRKIKNGEKTIDDMPTNLQWLKTEVQKELAPKNGDAVEEAVKKALQKKRDEEELTLLIDDMEDLSEEKLAEFREEYEALRNDGLSPLKSTLIARKVVGLKDSDTVIRERRKKGMLLPPAPTVARKKRKDDMSDVERKFMNNLPPMYK